MDKKVNREPIDKWINENYPDGQAKLGRKSQVSSNSIAKIRLGWVPKNRDARMRLAKALGVEHDTLFVPFEDSEAS